MTKRKVEPMGPAVSVRKAKRAGRAVEALGSAAQAIGPVHAGMAPVYLLTRGQFSMLDMVLHCLDQLGPAHVSVWTWAIADYEVEAMHGLMVRRELLTARLVVDRSAEHRDKAGGNVVGQWRVKFGPESVRVCRNHSKQARVWVRGGARVLLRGSMNLNHNPRLEQADISEGGPEFELVTRVEDELPVLPPLSGHDQATAASKLHGAWTDQGLKPFGGVKPWAK
jgi:hypothetical protein